MKCKLKACQLDEQVVFWKWISSDTIGIITSTHVYHWSLHQEPNDPIRIFERNSNLADFQIINYMADSSMKWFCINGIGMSEGIIIGQMQLYSLDRNVSQPIEGYASSFTTFEGPTGPCILFAFVTKARLYVMEIGKSTEEQGYQKKVVDIVFSAETGEFPVSMRISEKYIYIVTKQGYVYVYDVKNVVLICKKRLSSDVIFVTTLHPPSGGILGIDRKGSVFVVNVEENVEPENSSET